MNMISLFYSLGLIWTTFCSNVQTQDAKARRSDFVVKVNDEAAKPDADGNQSLTVTFNIDTSWHAYAHSLPKDVPGMATSIKSSALDNVEARTIVSAQAE